MTGVWVGGGEESNEEPKEGILNIGEGLSEGTRVGVAKGSALKSKLSTTPPKFSASSNMSGSSGVSCTHKPLWLSALPNNSIRESTSEDEVEYTEVEREVVLGGKLVRIAEEVFGGR